MPRDGEFWRGGNRAQTPKSSSWMCGRAPAPDGVFPRHACGPSLPEAPSQNWRSPDRELLSWTAVMSPLFIRRVSLYARATLITSLGFTLANVIYGVCRYHREPFRIEVLTLAGLHSLALTLLPALLGAVLAAGLVSFAAPLFHKSLVGKLFSAPLFGREPELVARALSVLVTLGLFGLGAQQLSHHFMTRYHNAVLASLALTASLVVLAVAAYAFFCALGAFLGRLFAHQPQLARPALPLGLGFVLILGAAAAFFIAFPSIFYVYHPFDLLLLPASFLVFIVLAFVLDKRIEEPRAGIAPLIALLSLALILISAFSYGSRYRHRVWVEERFPVVKQLYRLATALTDRDGDGYSALFGGEDCNDRDASIHPGASDPAGDGIDSDCFAGDGGPEVSSMSDGRYYEGRLFDRAPNILLITADALRPDHLGCFGYKRDTSPFIDELCARSYRFHEAIAQSSRSIRSIPSTFTGFMPSQIAYGTEYLFPELLPENVLIAEVLRPRYRTAAVVGTNYFKPFKGFDQGFLSFRQDPLYTPPRERTVDWAIEELRKLRTDRRPFFLWTYLFHTHAPYLHDDLPSLYGPELVDAYDTEVRMLDGELRRLIDALEDLEFQRETVIILHSDHGEAFFEHGLTGHSHNTHREEIRSTLLIHIPGKDGGDIHLPVPLADLMPTIANLANIPLRHETPSRSLLPLMFGEEAEDFEDRLIFSEVLPDGVFPWDEKAIIRGKEKLIYDPRSGRVRLYDHTDDPFEHNDLSDERPELTAELLGLLRSWIAETNRPEQRDDVVVAENLLSALPEKMSVEVDVVVGGLFRVAGFDINKTEFRRGERIELDFYYEVLGETSQDLFFYVDVEGPRGVRIPRNFHGRHHPMNGRYRSYRFKRGQIIRDTVHLVVPEDFPAPVDITLTFMVASGRRPIPFTNRPAGEYRTNLIDIHIK